MNEIKRSPVDSLGYDFIPAGFLPPHKDEYYHRNRQNKSGINYRQLTAYEIEVLVRNRNMSDNWNRILVSEAFNPELVQDCHFFGLVRIGKLEPWYLEFHNLRRPVGLYNSTIISCDFGDNVVVDNVNYISHYIIGSDVMLVNVNEIAATNYAKFGNGILKDGEKENIRIWMEICNENGGRKILPFNGMQPGDAWLWSRYRDEAAIQNRFKEFTESLFDSKRGYYGIIGDRTVIKNTKIVKDVNIGSDAYIKGANKIKNVTINSSAAAKSQIGEGCELVNGIVDYGCRIFYGVKAVRFFLASHSQLKYGARLINSYLGNNSTISCCEVLNSLIFPSHEQHHNNSFLCAAVLQGQSNMAAGATIGSNHNSRSPDGEIVAGRGFWPGLCVSLKHNSQFACFTILAKGDYPAELRIPIPFSLVSNNVHTNELWIMPGYWFLYNMYALARNSRKYATRDQRIQPVQELEFNFLAPDTITEIVNAIPIIELATGRAYRRHQNKKPGADEEALKRLGRELLNDPSHDLGMLDIFVDGVENSLRKVRLLKAGEAYRLFRELVSFHATQCLLEAARPASGRLTAEALAAVMPGRATLKTWVNVGGQLIPEDELNKLMSRIKSGRLKGWDGIHAFYASQSANYKFRKLEHAFAAYRAVYGVRPTAGMLPAMLEQCLRTREWMVAQISQSRLKDYQNPFRKMVYDSMREMETVIGKFDENSFIAEETADLAAHRKEIRRLIKELSAKPLAKSHKK